jgi:DNA polymerase-3 subunit delta
MSSPSAERAFWGSLKSRTFSHAYYLHGDDEYLKEQALRALLAAAVDPATRDFNLDLRNAGEVDGEVVGSLLGTPPMMAERRVVVFRDIAAMRKDARAALDRFLARPASGTPDVVAVLVAQGGEKAKVDRGLESKALAVEFAPLASDRVPRWIQHHVTSELGAAITPEAVALLDRAVGNDLPALAAELDKLASYANGAPIDEEAVAAVVGVRRGETLGDFLDLVARRDAARALALLPHILEQPKTSGVSIVMALTTQTLALLHGVGLLARRASPAQLQGAFFELLKAAPSSMTGRPWGEAARAWAESVRHWDAPSLYAALDALLAADCALKETRISSDEQILATLVLAMCAGGQRGSGKREAGRDPASHSPLPASPVPA